MYLPVWAAFLSAAITWHRMPAWCNIYKLVARDVIEERVEKVYFWIN